jgi:ATP:corrinoid adenosyltransferase
MTEQDDHKAKMERLKASVDRRIEVAQEEKGLLPVLRRRPPMQHVVLTGRGAKEALIEEADLVTEMKQIKHPFRKGVKAQQGVEF